MDVALLCYKWVDWISPGGGRYRAFGLDGIQIGFDLTFLIALHKIAVKAELKLDFIFSKTSRQNL